MRFQFEIPKNSSKSYSFIFSRSKAHSFALFVCVPCFSVVHWKNGSPVNKTSQWTLVYCQLIRHNLFVIDFEKNAFSFLFIRWLTVCFALYAWGKHFTILNALFRIMTKSNIVALFLIIEHIRLSQKELTKSSTVSKLFVLLCTFKVPFHCPNVNFATPFVFHLSVASNQWLLIKKRER